MEVEDVENDDDDGIISMSLAGDATTTTIIDENEKNCTSSSRSQFNLRREVDSSPTSHSNLRLVGTSETGTTEKTTPHSLPPEKNENVLSNTGSSHVESGNIPLETTFEMVKVPPQLQTGSMTYDMESRGIVQTPSPKPTDFYIWQPMKPGYAVRMESPSAVTDHPRPRHRTSAAATPSADGANQSESGLKQVIPVMPRPWSIVCCVLNIFLPGLGTVLSGISVLCCSHPRFVHLSRSSVVCLNAWVGLLQLLTTMLLLFGWVWSIVWAVNFITISNNYSRKEIVQRTLAGHRGRLPPAAPPTHPRRVTDIHRNAAAVLSTESPHHPTVMSTTSSSLSSSHPPIIVLNEAPAVLVLQRTAAAVTCEEGGEEPDDETPSWCNWRTTTRQRSNHVLQQTRRRASRRRRDSVQLLQQGDNYHPEMLLSPGTLETIVIHNGAYFVQGIHSHLDHPTTHHRSQQSSSLPITATTTTINDGDFSCSSSGSIGDPRPPTQKTTTTTSSHAAAAAAAAAADRTRQTTGHQ